MRCRATLYLFLCLSLAGCGERFDLAPVVDSNWRQHRALQGYRVVRGDTLYSIAFRYDMDYRYLAKINRINSPYTVRVGQVLWLSLHHNPRSMILRPHKRTPSAPKSYVNSSSRGGWIWPAHGRVAQNFSPQQGQKGINIAGHRGEKIVAAADGVVAYAGSGLTGYGNLIIIKHNHQFLTAYGNNTRNWVHEGQTIHKGQVIAEMGVIDHQYWGVHFEIRHAGRPINPLQYLSHFLP